MPIRINLLAAEQAAEESRRRDPIKRAIFGSVALVVLMLGWIAITQLKVSAARAELAMQTNKLGRVELSSKQVRNSQVASMEASSRVTALDKYTGNRFLWGTFLDALQQITVDHLRLTEVRAEQKHSAADPVKFYSTNVIVGYAPDPPAWKFWAAKPEQPAIATLVSNLFPTITNIAQFTTNTLKYTMKVTEQSTNTAASQVTAQVDFTNVRWAAENITVEIRGRDYGTPAGGAIDEFAKRLTGSAYIKSMLSTSHGFRFTERPPQARPDPQDRLNPNALFVPFTIELVLDTRTFTNDETL